jgi:hypothetical protein
MYYYILIGINLYRIYLIIDGYLKLSEIQYENNKIIIKNIGKLYYITIAMI